MTLSDVAELTLLSWDTVKNIVKTHLAKDYGKPFLKGVRYLGIDEIHVGKKGCYYTIVLDLEDGRILWAKPGRGGAALRGFWRRLRQAKAKIRAVAMRGHETILVVEDEVALRRLVSRSLRLMGYAVFEAENGQSAMNLWQQRRGEFDLLFSDMVMPEGLTGLDLAEKLKKEKPGLKVIISSGYSSEIAGQSRLAAHGILYLQKPYRVEILAKTVRDCLDGKS
jgi:CheY-like chemotaxis protein